ncbi:MAG: hypothetical protein IT379_32545, partial [Deltaproteobacteria bacterium]|nr:hypothetical protein [Deltaproteobacteria bacterium]
MSSEPDDVLLEALAKASAPNLFDDKFEIARVTIDEHVSSRFAQVGTEVQLRKVRADAQRFLDRVAEHIRHVPREQKRSFGVAMNRLRGEFDSAFEARLAAIRAAARESDLAGPEVDTTLPGVAPRIGRLHPLRIMAEDAIDAFARLGFDVIDGPEVELYDYNFTKLNFPPDHPATDMQDSFFL